MSEMPHTPAPAENKQNSIRKTFETVPFRKFIFGFNRSSTKRVANIADNIIVPLKKINAYFFMKDHFLIRYRRYR